MRKVFAGKRRQANLNHNLWSGIQSNLESLFACKPGRGISIGNISHHISTLPCSMPGLSGLKSVRVSMCSGTRCVPTRGISCQWCNTAKARCSSFTVMKHKKVDIKTWITYDIWTTTYHKLIYTFPILLLY